MKDETHLRVVRCIAEETGPTSLQNISTLTVHVYDLDFTQDSQDTPYYE
jgi:hypothetical protein